MSSTLEFIAQLTTLKEGGKREEVYLSCGAEGRWDGSVRGREGRRWAHKERPLHHLGSV